MMVHAGIFGWLGPGHLIHAAGPWALLVVCAIVFAETGLLIGFIFPGDTLLLITGLLTFAGTMTQRQDGIMVPIWLVCLAVGVAAFVGGQCGYLIGNRVGPRIFERRDSGLFSKHNVESTNRFFDRYGGMAVLLARFVPIVRTFAPVAAGVGHMDVRRYSIYNLVSAFVWAAGLTLVGFFLGFIPPVGRFVTHYIDIILLGAVVVAIVPTSIHTILTVRRTRKSQQAEAKTSET